MNDLDRAPLLILNESDEGLRQASTPVAAAHRLSLARIAEATHRIDPVFRNTPQFVCEPLSELLGVRVTLKVEMVNPIRSFKGRGADFLLSCLGEAAAREPMVCASAGNFGQGLAYACRSRGVALVVYVARDASALKVERMRALGAEVRVSGADFDAAKEAARAWAATSGARMVEDGAVPAISEGAGTIAVELLERDAGLDAVLVPLGNGALLNGMARWIKSASPATQVIGVCSQGAPAMAESWRLGPGAVVVSHASVDTLADGIAVRAPIAEAVADMHGLVDDVMLVDDASMVEATRLVHRHAGLVVEPGGAAGLAALLSDRARFAGQRVATVLCGGNLTPDQIRAWIETTPPHLGNLGSTNHD